MARLVRDFLIGDDEFFQLDHAPGSVAAKRRLGLQTLTQDHLKRHPQGIEYYSRLEGMVSDVQFTSNYRIPYPYRRLIPAHLRQGLIINESKGSQIKTVDGEWLYDVSGSYGVNVFGYDFYKGCMSEGYAAAQAVGPVLGPYHPSILENVQKLCQISGLDEVSFHMSGTEAVMQAVRLARYHTGKSHLVRFCGAYHGWWDGVQPGVGNQRKVSDVYTLSEMSEKTLKVLATHRNIACVLINPLQGFHPNVAPPGDGTLINSARDAEFNRDAYQKWLQRLCEVCRKHGIIIIFDEVFTGFRLGMGGAQDYFKCKADLVTYGKTIAGGLPIGALCGRADLMKRFKEHQPVNISFARGTFNSHPYVMSAMNAFLRRIEDPQYQMIYREADRTWARRIDELNQLIRAKELPLQVRNFHSVLTVLYTRPSWFNWLFQFYLRNHGIESGWTGTGRMIMSLSMTDSEFSDCSQRFVAAAEHMNQDGWWWSSPSLNNKQIKRQFFRRMIAAQLGRFANNQSHQSEFDPSAATSSSISEAKTAEI
jgi:glutamate-1-semialdehyde 2,1-aminomutase